MKINEKYVDTVHNHCLCVLKAYNNSLSILRPSTVHSEFLNSTWRQENNSLYKHKKMVKLVFFMDGNSIDVLYIFGKCGHNVCDV